MATFDLVGPGIDQWLCAICADQSKPKKLAETEWLCEMPGDRTYEIFECASCSVVATHPVPTTRVLQEYYSNYAPTQITPYRDQELTSLHAPIWDKLSSFVNLENHSVIGDYGFGAGAFLKFLSGVFPGQLYGLDYSAQNVEQLSQWSHKNNRSIHTALVNDDTPLLLPPRVNLFTMFQVVEHLRDPHAVLGKLATFQSTGDYLYLECPNQEAWFFTLKNLARSMLRRKHMYGSVSPPQHIFGFNRLSLRILIERAGYDLVFLEDYWVADGIHAPETTAWYPSIKDVISGRVRLNSLVLGKALIRALDPVASRRFGLGGGLSALARRR